MMIFSKNNDFNLNIFLNGERIEIVDVHKSLGFFIDNKLSFNQHINYVVSRISFILRKLYNVSTYLPMAIRRKVGISLCFPLFLYGLEMYSCTSRENLNSLQLCINRVVRFIYKLGVREHVSGYRFQLLNYDFDDFISSRQIILFYRFKKYNCPSYLARKFEFCGSNRTYSIIYPNFSSLTMNRSFILKVSRLWNSVIPYSDRRFSHSIKDFANIFKCNL